MPTSTSRNAPAATPARPSSGISRIDQASRRTHGYFVRVGYKRTSKGYRPSHTSFFGDATHGGKRKAWEAAEAWLRKTRRALAKSKPAKRARRS